VLAVVVVARVPREALGPLRGGLRVVGGPLAVLVAHGGLVAALRTWCRRGVGWLVDDEKLVSLITPRNW